MNNATNKVSRKPKIGPIEHLAMGLSELLLAVRGIIYSTTHLGDNAKVLNEKNRIIYKKQIKDIMLIT